LNTALGAVCSTALSEAEKEALTVFCYESSHHLREDGLRPLFDWESRWFARDLPPAPATILVPGAGAGREVVALRTLGYRVFGFDPALVESPNQHGIVRGRFRDLMRHRPGRLDLPGTFHTPVDAVLFGWGSVSHVYDPQLRFQILEAAAACAPKGPILLSYWTERDIGASGLATHAGLTAGRVLARIRRTGINPTLRCYFSPNGGLTTCMTHTELNDIARSLNRSLRVSSGAYGHATLYPQ